MLYMERSSRLPLTMTTGQPAENKIVVGFSWKKWIFRVGSLWEVWWWWRTEDKVTIPRRRTHLLHYQTSVLKKNSWFPGVLRRRVYNLKIFNTSIDYEHPANRQKTKLELDSREKKWIFWSWILVRSVMVVKNRGQGDNVTRRRTHLLHYRTSVLKKK